MIEHLKYRIKLLDEYLDTLEMFSPEYEDALQSYSALCWQLHDLEG